MSKVSTHTNDKTCNERLSHNFTEEIMKATTNTPSNAKSEVLFQKLGNTWYVFSEIKGELVYSALPYGMDPHTTSLELFEVIETHLEKVSNHYSTGRRKPELAV